MSTTSRSTHCATWLTALLLVCLPTLSSAQTDGSDEEPVEQPTANEPATTELDEITVSASYSLNRTTPAEGIALSREQILELPTFADDLFRAINLVPGASGNDVSSAFSLRGAPYEEILVRLDGVELFEPFHLKDFSGVLSIVDAQVVDGIEIFPGAFPAAYGDRSAGVVDLTSRRPAATETRWRARPSPLPARSLPGPETPSICRDWVDCPDWMCGFGSPTASRLEASEATLTPD